MPAPAAAPALPLFAYGSLTDAVFTGRLLERPLAPEPAVLLDFRKVDLRRLGYEVVVPAPGERVEGLVYRGMSRADYRRLDAYQGVGEGLYVREIATARPAPEAPGEPVCVYVPTPRSLRRYGRDGPPGR